MPLLTAFALAAALTAAEPVELKLWSGLPDRETVETGAGGRAVKDVTAPSMKVFLPPTGGAAAATPAIIVCPGGGYTRLMIDKEGEIVARMLNEMGLVAMVLRYRLMPSELAALPREEQLKLRPKYTPLALEDAKRAVRIARLRAVEWRIDPKRIGVMGFSAGGHVAANLAMHYDEDSRPDAVMPVYAGRFDSYQFRPNSPPMFILHAGDDATVPAEASAQLYLAMKKAGAPAELHVYPRGGHGFALNKTGGPIDKWPDRLRDWLVALGWLAP
jgi:acetyl esterase/lipase